MIVWTLTDSCVRRTIEFFLLEQSPKNKNKKNPEACVATDRNQSDTNPAGQVSLDRVDFFP